MKIIEEIFETFLFNSRIIALVAVLGSLVASFVMFIKGTLQILNGIFSFYEYAVNFHPGATHGPDTLVAIFVSSVDNYLFATVLLIFSMGLYELFISKIDPASRSPESRPNWLRVESLDDLKASLGKVILMILIVSFFEQSLSIIYSSSLDLLYLGIGILLVGGALYVTHLGHKH
ncbi:MAG: YqhA family protein [Deltaproteobacteria bacterium]|jgi:uncharacterized membrane protein YqhA|nr:YqhA family protein [Deltaproteobacteria bacterium]